MYSSIMTSSFTPLCAADSSVHEHARAAGRDTCRMAQRLARQAWAQWSGQAVYTLCLAEFEWGATFLALLRTWRTYTVRPSSWHVVAVAQRPWSRQALDDMLRSGLDVGEANDRDALLDQWPPMLPGQHRLSFEAGAVTLTLLFGPARQVLGRAGFGADGFLGGDADMFSAMASHARATAWWLRSADAQDLRQVGFVPADLPPDEAPPALVLARRRENMPVRAIRRNPVAASERAVVVVGAGIAGASIAATLARRGWAVKMIGSPATHVGHTAAALTPVMARDDNVRARLTRAGALRARAHWMNLGPDVVRCTGTLQLDRPGGRGGDAGQTVRDLGFPPDWLRAVDRSEACALAGLSPARGGMYISGGLLVRPDKLVATLTATPGISLIDAMVHRVESSGTGWRVLDAGGAVLAEAAYIVVAAAHASAGILEASDMLADVPLLASMHRLAGEISLLPAHLLPKGPECVIGGEGYVLPAVEGHIAVGSTYAHGASQSSVSLAGQQTNIQKMLGLLDEVAHPRLHPALVAETSDSYAGPANAPYPGWAGWRAVVPGRLPVIGELVSNPGIWVATAYASRGLTWSALAADMIAGGLAGEPDVLDRDLAALIAPR